MNWYCFDEEQDEEIELYGNKDSGTAMTLRINLMLCDPAKTTCDQNFNKSQFFADKWLAILYN